MERVEGAGGALGKHIDGDGKRPETAAPRVLVGADGVEEKLKPVVLLDDEGEEIDLAAAKTRTAEAQKYMQKCRRKKTRGRQPMGGSTWVFAGPPRYDSEDAWSSTEVRSWAADCTKWLKKRSGKGSRIAHCALHQDEAAPHLHVTVIVADEQGRLGWNRIRKNFGVEGKASGLLLMSGLQDNFHAAVGSKHGLDRGEVGSNREHAPVDRALGLKIRVEEEKNRSHEARVLAGRRIAGAMEREEAVGSRETAVARRESALKRRHKEAQGRETAVGGRETAVEARERQADDLVRRVKNAELGLHFEKTDRLTVERDCETAQRERNEARRKLDGAEDRGKVAGVIEGRDERNRELQEWLPTHDKEVEARLRGQEEQNSLAGVADTDENWTLAGVADEQRRRKAQTAAKEVLKREAAVGEREELQKDLNAAQRDRDQAWRDLETRTTERNGARTKRDEALGAAGKAELDRDGWVDRFVKVVRDLNPGRAELERAAGRGGIKKEWLVQEVERGRGGMDR